MLLTGCTTIEIGGDLVVLSSVGEGCYATRGTQSAAEGQGQADVALTAQQGAGGGAGALTRVLSSRVGCPPEVAE